MTTEPLPSAPERVARLTYGGRVMLRSRDLCESLIPSVPESERDRLQRAFRDAFPAASKRFSPGENPGGFYIYSAYRKRFELFLSNPTNQHEAAVAEGVGRGFAAARRKLGFRFNMVIQNNKVAVDGSDPEFIRQLLTKLDEEISARDAEIERLRAVAKRAVDRAIEADKRMRDAQSRKPRIRVPARRAA